MTPVSQQSSTLPPTGVYSRPGLRESSERSEAIVDDKDIYIYIYMLHGLTLRSIQAQVLRRTLDHSRSMMGRHR